MVYEGGSGLCLRVSDLIGMTGMIDKTGDLEMYNDGTGLREKCDRKKDTY